MSVRVWVGVWVQVRVWVWVWVWVHTHTHMIYRIRAKTIRRRNVPSVARCSENPFSGALSFSYIISSTFSPLTLNPKPKPETLNLFWQCWQWLFVFSLGYFGLVLVQ